ncbi:MAG: hypothetical protein ACRECD_02905 [Burkholderiaceae bacterium]
MSMPPPFVKRFVPWATGMALAAPLLGGCTVIAVADTAATIAVKTVGLAADAAIGTVRITGKVVGAAVDAAIPDSAEPAKP